MEVEQAAHMKGGLGQSSYANNSSLQRTAISKVKPILEESVRRVYCRDFPECLRIADLGCSSGPNTLLVVSEILDAVDKACRSLNTKPPAFQFFLNDLPGNDFNTLFQTLAGFHERLERDKGPKFGPCFVNATPGSFYGRLFPNNSMHFVHSSYSLHWLPQVPKGLVSERGEALNKGNILISSTSPPEVFKAYHYEFRKSFTSFLGCRSQEIVSGGRMLLTLIGRNDNPKNILEVLGRTLNDMALEGIIEVEKVDHFNLRCYTPTAEEAKTVIDEEGSFSLQKLDVFETDCDAGFGEPAKDNDAMCKRGQYVSDYLKAILEPTLARKFGETITDELFRRFTFSAMEAMEKEKWPYVNLVFDLKKE